MPRDLEENVGGYTHFTGEKTEAWQGEVPRPRWHSSVGQLGFVSCHNSTLPSASSASEGRGDGRDGKAFKAHGL